MFGKTHSTETLEKMSVAKLNENNPMYGKTGENHPVSKKVFVYSNLTPTVVSYEFVTCSEAAKHFNCNISTISRYLDKNKFYKG